MAISETKTMRITLPDGSVREYDRPVTALQVAADIGPGLAKAAIGAKVDGELADIGRLISRDAALSIVTGPKINKKGKSSGEADPDALYLLRHSTAHVMAEAICRLWPGTQLAYGPPVDNGFYYDLALETPISSDDFGRIEEEMGKIVAEDRPFTRYELTADQGFEKLRLEENKYKLDNAQRAIEGGAACLSWYVTGEHDPGNGLESELGGPWEDLCMGPHVPSTGRIGAFKVMSIASSHWHGDIESDRFQRVYGTAFFTQGDLDAHLEQLEEAKQRDHRVIGQKLGLFAIDEQVGQGLILWKPRGAMVRTILQDFLQNELFNRGYEIVYTPHIGKIDLYKTSGHYPYYEDSQFPQIRQIRDETRPLLVYLRQLRDDKSLELDKEQEKELVEKAKLGDGKYPFDEPDINIKLATARYFAQSGESYLLKPMNCPHHIKIFASEPHSYRDLPIRLAEFGTVYRFEQSGELTGMTRVRGFTQDDAHIFCTHEQVKDEFRATVELVQFVFGTFGFDDVHIRLSLRDPDSDKYAGEKQVWDRAEDELRDVLKDMGVTYSEEPGEAAFYGPKVDFIVRDVIGRKWQLGTVQLDYSLPERFGIEYIGADNQPHRPVMIHRAPFGSMERFMAILIEHYAGAFPLWLAPEQVRVLPISEKFADYAQKVLAALKQAGFRARVDTSGGRVQGKIKVAQDLKVPYMLVVGGRDEQGGTVSVRDRARGDLGAMSIDGFVEAAKAEAHSRGGRVVEVG